MKDVLGKPRILIVAAAALTTSLGIGAGWGARAWVRGEEPAGRTPGAEPVVWRAQEDPDSDPVDELDYAAMLETLEAAGMRVAPEKALYYLDAPVIRPDGRLSQVFADALLLGENEVERVNRIIGEAEIRLREAELDRMTVAERSDERVVLRFGTFREEGAVIERMLRNRILAELGQADGRLLLMLMNRGPRYSSRDYWGGFGRTETSVVFEKERLETPEEVEVLELRFSYGPAGEEATAGNNGTDPPVRRARVRTASGGEAGEVGEALAGRHAHLHRFLPLELRRHFRREP